MIILNTTRNLLAFAAVLAITSHAYAMEDNNEMGRHTTGLDFTVPTIVEQADAFFGRTNHRAASSPAAPWNPPAQVREGGMYGQPAGSTQGQVPAATTGFPGL